MQEAVKVNAMLRQKQDEVNEIIQVYRFFSSLALSVCGYVLICKRIEECFFDDEHIQAVGK